MNIGYFASAVTEEHELFLQALNGRYLQMLSPGKAPSPIDIIDLNTDIRKTRDALRARVSDKADELVSSLGIAAETPSEEVVLRLLSEFKRSFALVTLKNVADVVDAGRKGRDDLGRMFNRSMGAAMGELVMRKAQKIDFKVPDSAGRKWDATRYMSFIAREFVYRLKLAKQVSELLGDFAEVFYPDHDSDGMVFSVRGDHPGMPTYTELLPTVFHPNSKAEVRPHAFA